MDLLASWETALYQWLGIKPLTPRGSLDVSYGDLFHGVVAGCQSSSQECQSKNAQISALWKDKTGQEVAVGLSVRSLFDLYLSTKQYPSAAEVIVYPPISVPGMMHVAQYHDMRIVPVDIEKEWWNMKGIQAAITSRTVAIMIVHPFGMLSTSPDQLQELRQLADTHRLEVWEDCAECYTGLGKDCYLGSPLADVRFFSFGMIKTSTAMGGGIAAFRDPNAKASVERLSRSLPQQSTFRFIGRLLLAAILNFIAASNFRVGLLAAICSFLGLDFDRVITHLLRGFQLPTRNAMDPQQCTRLIQQIRHRPCYALLSLLHRRLRQSDRTAPSVLKRRKQCEAMEQILLDKAPQILIPCPPKAHHTYWSFPIVCSDRDKVSRKLHELGFDVVSAASQLQCVSGWSSGIASPRTEAMMNSILYLPIASQTVSEKSMTKLATSLVRAIQEPDTRKKPLGCPKCNGQSFGIWGYTACFLLPAFLLLTLVGPRFGFSRVATFCWLSRATMGSLVTVALCMGLVVCALRWNMTSFYLSNSSAFAEHCDMVDAATAEQVRDDKAKHGAGVLSQMEALKLPLNQRGEGSVLLTGATGFVGSLLLRDLLLHREALRLTGGVVVICRKKGSEGAESRITKLLSKPMFSFLSESEKNSLVQVMEGDVEENSAGLCPRDLTRICEELPISHVFHCAAAVSFAQDLPDAARANITSSLNMQALTARLRSPSAKFVHISTAFVHGSRNGSKTCPLPEDLFPLDPFDPSEIYKSMLGTQYYATKAMSDFGFPNTYPFSKCVCEHLLLQQSDGNTIIIRPSIVGPAVEAPFEGWAGSKPSTIVAGACLHLSNQWNLWYLTKNTVAYVPVDVLSRFIMAKSFEDRDATCSSDATTSSDETYEKVSQVNDSSSDLGESMEDASRETDFPRRCIFNATWDESSSDRASFSWQEFGVTYLQLGCILGYFDRATAYLTLLVSAKSSPRLFTSGATYDLLHSTFVRRPIELVDWVLTLIGVSENATKRLLSVLDLPILFFPFVKRSYHFQSDLIAPSGYDSHRYVFSTAVAGHRFVSAMKSKQDSLPAAQPSEPHLSATCVGGAHQKTGTSDIWWALSQPRGDIFVRLAAFLFIKILRAVCAIVTVDVTSFRGILSSMKTSGRQKPYLVLAPTHRSFFDFILLSYIMFAIPELQLDIPYVVAADDFEHLPGIGWFARLVRAFYIQRGRGCEDPKLKARVEELKKQKLNTPGACLEVFLEGTRSRDRRFVEPKTGFLKCLSQTGGDHVVVPIAISYEGIPEERILSQEASGGSRREMSVVGLFHWLKDAARGVVDLGRVHVAAGEPLSFSSEQDTDFKEFANEIQRRQQKLVSISDYHLRAAARYFKLKPVEVSQAFKQTRYSSWPSAGECSTCRPVPLPKSESGLFSAALQLSPQLAPSFYQERQDWSNWLNRVELQIDNDFALKTQPISDLLSSCFDAADDLVDKAVERLADNGFDEPSQSHVFQTAKLVNEGITQAILNAAVTMKIPSHQRELTSGTGSTVVPDLSITDTQEHVGLWGFNDSGFIVKITSGGEKTVTMKGNRYSLCGKSMSKLLPFMENQLGVQLDPTKEFSLTSPNHGQEVPTRMPAEDSALLVEHFSRASFSTLDRLRHGTGHSQEDVYAIRSGSPLRIPDVVVWPSSEAEVADLVEMAIKRKWCLIPFGGGTNVSNATRCPNEVEDPRPMVSVDMKAMKRILWLNEEDGLAHVEAGITGRHLVEELERRGYTMGHEPDSIEFSTLGGWIATKSSGMKRSRYGNIEDIVMSTRMVGHSGLYWNGGEGSEVVAGRTAEGLDVRSFAIGSEGCLGIVTSAVIRIWPLPEVQEFDSMLFHNFEEGLRFVRELAKMERYAPASVRLLDNEHFRLGQALRPDDVSPLSMAKDLLAKAVLSGVRKYDPMSVVCVIIGYEGSRAEVSSQQQHVHKIGNVHRGLALGSTIGKSGYLLTFMIAYLRDFGMTYHLLGESFETFVPWSRIEKLVHATKVRIKQEHRDRLLPGNPFVGCRITQLYHEGACLYFYLCISFDGVKNASQVFSELERAARDEILKHGGSLSHHHGIGKHRASMLNDRASSAFKEALMQIKRDLDKDNVFGVRNGPFAFSEDLSK